MVSYNGRETETQRQERRRSEHRLSLWREMRQALLGDIHGARRIYLHLQDEDGNVQRMAINDIEIGEEVA